MVPNTERTHFSICLHPSKEWLEDAISQLENEPEGFGKSLCVVIKSNDPNIKYNVAGFDGHIFCGCGDLSDSVHGWEQPHIEITVSQTEEADEHE